MDDFPIDPIDVRNLQQCFLETDAELRAIRAIISTLENENKHLRQVIEMLITSKSPTL